MNSKIWAKTLQRDKASCWNVGGDSVNTQRLTDCSLGCEDAGEVMEDTCWGGGVNFAREVREGPCGGIESQPWEGPDQSQLGREAPGLRTD